MPDEPCKTGSEPGVVCARGGIGCPLTHDGHEPRYRGDKHLAYIRIGGAPHLTTERLDKPAFDDMPNISGGFEHSNKPAIDEIRPPFYEGCAKRGGVCDCGTRPCAITKPASDENRPPPGVTSPTTSQQPASRAKGRSEGADPS